MTTTIGSTFTGGHPVTVGSINNGATLVAMDQQLLVSADGMDPAKTRVVLATDYTMQRVPNAYRGDPWVGNASGATQVTISQGTTLYVSPAEALTLINLGIANYAS
jgi:hypothetical protein